MTTIYLVSAGSYSDYHVVALFSEKDRAEQLAAHENGRVEECLLDDPKWKEQLIAHSAKDKCWHCSLELVGGERAKNHPSLSGEEFSVSRWELSWAIQEGNKVSLSDYTDFDDQDYWKGSWDMSTLVIAETEETASKIAKERFDAFIEQRWKDGKPLPRGKNISDVL